MRVRALGRRGHGRSLAVWPVVVGALALLVWAGCAPVALAASAPPAAPAATGKAQPAAEKTAPQKTAAEDPQATPRPDATGVNEGEGFLDFQQPEFEKAPAAPSLWGVMGNLLLVFGLLGVVLWAVRRFLPGPLSDLRRSRHMRVLDTLPVAINRSLMLVSVAGEVRLLANTEKGLVDLGRVQHLGALKAEVAEEFAEALAAEWGPAPQEGAGTEPGEGVAGRLRQRLRRLGEQP